MKTFFFEAIFSNSREKSMTFSPITQNAIFPSASCLTKKGGVLIRGGALNTENTVNVFENIKLTKIVAKTGPS